MNEKRLAKKRIIIITGATGGIGSAVARTLAGPNTFLILQGRSRKSELEKMANQLRQKSAGVETFLADFSDERGQDSFVDRVAQTLDYVNPDAVSLLSWVHAAGIDLMTEPVKSLSFDEKLRLMFAVDVTAPIRMSRKIGNWMGESSIIGQMDDPKNAGMNASIIFFGWDGALRGMEGDTGALYAASKGALIAYVKSLAQSLAPFVRVLSISPGWIQTTWGKSCSQRLLARGKGESLLGRWGTPEEVAELVAFLLSDKGSYLNALNIEINGGFDCRPKTAG